MKMTVIGAGYVGISTALCFAHAGHETVLLECDARRLAELQAGRCPFYEPQAQEWMTELFSSGMVSATGSPTQAIPFGDIIWIAVNTPAGLNHQLDLRALEKAMNDIAQYGSQGAVIVIKSTVTAGTCRRLLLQRRKELAALNMLLVFNPEFLREGHAIQDFMNPSRVILGTEDGGTPTLISEAYQSLGIPDTRIISTKFEDAEVIKQASNSFLAIKLTYANELANYCRQVSADIRTVVYCMGLDERIAPGYMETGLGYGGACLPKDTEALAADASKNGTPLTVLEQTISANEAQIKSAADVVRRHIPPESTLAVWGISFKPGSGDLRCSPAWRALSILMENATYRFQLYDPYFKDWQTDGLPLPSCIKVCPSADKAVENADGLLILTAHEPFLKADLQVVKLRMRNYFLFDFFDFISDQNANAAGLIRITKTD